MSTKGNTLQMELSPAVTISFTYLSKTAAFTFYYLLRNVLKKKKKILILKTNKEKTQARSKC